MFSSHYKPTFHSNNFTLLFLYVSIMKQIFCFEFWIYDNIDKNSKLDFGFIFNCPKKHVRFFITNKNYSIHFVYFLQSNSPKKILNHSFPQHFLFRKTIPFYAFPNPPQQNHAHLFLFHNLTMVFHTLYNACRVIHFALILPTIPYHHEQTPTQ